jgi:hypothetical protein
MSSFSLPRHFLTTTPNHLLASQALAIRGSMWPKGFSHPFTPSFPCSHSLSLQTHSNLKPCRNEESLHVFMEDWLCVSYHKLSWLRYCDSSSFFPFHSNFNSKTLTSYPCYSGVACVVLTIVGNCKEVWEWRNWVGVAAVSKLSHSSKFRDARLAS